MSQTVDIVCDYFDPDKFPPLYIQKLYDMVQRNLRRPFRFFCLTDQQDLLKTEGVTSKIRFVSPLDSLKDLPDSWRRLSIFSPEMPMKGQVLFLGLNTVILDNIDCLFQYKGQFRMIESARPQFLPGSMAVACFDAGAHTRALDLFLESPTQAMKDFKTIDAFLTRALGPGRPQFWPELWCKHFSSHCLAKWRPFQAPVFPYGAKVLVFDHPLPHQALSGQWSTWMPFQKKPALWLERFWGKPSFVMRSIEKVAA